MALDFYMVGEPVRVGCRLKMNDGRLVNADEFDYLGRASTAFNPNDIVVLDESIFWKIDVSSYSEFLLRLRFRNRAATRNI